MQDLKINPFGTISKVAVTLMNQGYFSFKLEKNLGRIHFRILQNEVYCTVQTELKIQANAC